MVITLSMEDLTLLSSTMYRTSTMIEAFRSIPPASTFLRDKLFGTVVTAATDNVMLDYFRGDQRLAFFASRHKKGVTVPRERSKTNVFSPGFLKPVIPLASDVLFYRSMGVEAINGKPAVMRDAELLGEDAITLDTMISRTEEWMVCECLFTGKVTCLDGDDLRPVSVVDYGEISKTITAKPWTDPTTCDPLSDLKACCRAVSAACGYHADLICMGKDSADQFENASKVNTVLSQINNHSIVHDPKYVEQLGVYGVDVITTGWQGIPIYSYEAQYEDSSGNSQFYCPPNCVLIASSLLQNRLTYAGVAQLSEDQSGTKGSMDVFEGRRIPQIYSEESSDTRFFRMVSRPLPCPTNLLSWTVLQTSA
jgi:Phage major capsid protein E